jgi:N utilization substance protein B
LGRRETRECAMKLIFQTMLQRDDIEEQINRFCEENQLAEGVELDYFLDVVRGVISHAEEIDERISRYSKGWMTSRMPKVDLSIMRLSSYEMAFRNDIPASVSINEAVELSKKYGDDHSQTFVNGVLAKVYLDIHPVQGADK